MNEEEEKYDDFLESQKEDNSLQTDSQDSFAKGILKANEEHKKTEQLINQRPISSYHNNNNQNKNLNKEDIINPSKQKPQSAHPISSNNSNSNKSKSFSSKNEKESDKTFEEIITDLKNFLEKNNIKKTDFIENKNVFLSFEEFKAQLHSIHYTIPREYVRVLFNYNNEGEKDDYISIAKFMKYLYEESEESSEVSYSNISMSNKNDSSFSSKKLKNSNNIKKEKYEMEFLNEQFSVFNKDIIDIIKNTGNKYYFSTNSTTKNRPASGKSKISSNSSKINIESRPMTANKKTNSNIKNEEEKISSDEYALKYLIDEKDKKNQKFNPKDLIKRRELEKKRENEKIRKQIEKRKNEYKNECFEKCVEMNKICETLKLKKRYKIISKNDELYCVFKTIGRNKIGEMDIKNFDIEYRRLNKMYQQRDIKERYAPQEIPPKKDMEIIVKERQNEKNEKKKDIKEVLIEAVRLKTKLKNQLDNLKSKVKIDERVVIEQLLKAGIELPHN